MLSRRRACVSGGCRKTKIAQAFPWAIQHDNIYVLPTFAYAIEARLTDNAGERKAALVKAVYLDRKSERLSRLPPSELEEALKAAGKTPPFKSGPENPGRGV